MHLSVCLASASCRMALRAVVEQDDVKLLRPVAGVHSGPDRVVGVHALAGGRARQRLQEDFEVLKARDHLLDSGDGDQHLGQGEAHPAIAFRLDDADASGLGDQEVGAADGDLARARNFSRR